MERIGMRRPANTEHLIRHGKGYGEFPAPLLDGGIFESRILRKFGDAKVTEVKDAIQIRNLRGCNPVAYVRFEFDSASTPLGECSMISHFGLGKDPVDSSIELAKLFDMDGMVRILEGKKRKLQ